MKKDESKNTSTPIQKDSKKQRGFLKSLSLAVTAVLTSSPFLSPSISHAHIQPSIIKPETTITRPAAENNTLVIHPSNTNAGIGALAQHSSHSSHVSHESHVSHHSHYSSSY